MPVLHACRLAYESEVLSRNDTQARKVQEPGLQNAQDTVDEGRHSQKVSRVNSGY